MVSGCDPGEPGVAGEGMVDGVDGADAVTAGAGEVGADAQVVAEGVGGVPVPGDGLVPLWASKCLLGRIIGPRDFEVLREQPDLLGLVLEPLGECEAGMVAFVPVPMPVCGDAPRDGRVVTLTQSSQQLWVELVGADGSGLLDSLRRVLQYLDDRVGPVLPVRVQLQDALAVSDEVSYALLHPGQVWVELVPADVVVAHQEAMPVIPTPRSAIEALIATASPCTRP